MEKLDENKVVIILNEVLKKPTRYNPIFEASHAICKKFGGEALNRNDLTAIKNDLITTILKHSKSMKDVIKYSIIMIVVTFLGMISLIAYIINR